MVKPIAQSVRHPKDSKSLLPAANDNDEVIVPVLSSDPEDNPSVPYYEGAPNFPHVQLDLPLSQHSSQPFQSDSEPQSRKGDEYKLDRRLPIEESDFYYDSPRRPVYPRPKKKPKKLMKAVERVYYYPEDSDSEINRNKKELNKMRRHSPRSFEPYYNAEDPEDTPFEPIKKDLQQMDDNPPRGEFDEPPSEETDESQLRPTDPTQSSIASDVKQFGKEAVDEAHRFETFLDNLRNFAENSEKEYATPRDNMGQNGEDPRDDPSSAFPSDDGNFGIRNGYNPNLDDTPTYGDSMAAIMSDSDANVGERDRTRDYDKPVTYGDSHDYDSEKNSFQRQKDMMDNDERQGRKRKSGHRYHKDRRRGRRRLPDASDEEYDSRNKEITGLIEREPDEDDYLSNRDVVRQMSNSEKKYNVGADPVYSSQRDFDEVSRLERMIENVALLNKEKEKRASLNHNRREATEESKVKTIKVKVNDDKKTKKNIKNKDNQ